MLSISVIFQEIPKNTERKKTMKDHKKAFDSPVTFSGNIENDAASVFGEFNGSFDIIRRKIICSGRTAYVFMTDGMCDEIKITEGIIKPVTDMLYEDNGISFNEYIKTCIFKGVNVKEIKYISEAATEIIMGNLLFVADKEQTALSFPVQGFPKKNPGEPQAEQNERGSQESFTDNFKDNVTLLRRRLRTPSLVIEQHTVGKTSNTPVLVCYMSDRASSELLSSVKKRISKIELDAILGSGYIRPFLDNRRPSFFTDTGITERPDTFSSMLLEGRIGIIVDGTPFALIVPYLFIDYFHAVDDYLSSTYYAFFMRSLRIISFIIASTLPGAFVAICLFHPEIMPADIMYGIAAATSKTPFPIMVEALTIHFIYEIVREAGLRMPRSVGHAVSIVGALVIGDAAVTAGLIAAPMLIVVALTAISSSVIVKLHEPVAIMRFGFIIIGGFTGLYGIMLGIGIMIVDICSVSPYGIPFSAPLSPFVKRAQMDALIRKSWTKVKENKELIQRMKY